MKRYKWGILVVIFLCLYGNVYAIASDLEEETEKNDVIQYYDGSYAEITGKSETVKDDLNSVIGSKTYIYHDLSGEVLFTYTVKVSYLFDGSQARSTGCCTTFYLSDGWEKKKDTFNGNSGTAVFSNGRKTKTIKLTISCGKDGEIS